MNIYVLLVAIAITVCVLLGVQLVAVKTLPRKLREIERDLEQICCMIFFSLPIAVTAIVLHYYPLCAFGGALVWALVFGISKKIYPRRLLKDISIDYRIALAFLAMLLCIAYFLIDAVFMTREHFEVIGDVIAIIMGFFISIRVLLSDEPFWGKCCSIIQETKVQKLSKRVKILFGLCVCAFLMQTCIEKFTNARNYDVEIYCGLIVGVICYLPFLFLLKNTTFDALKDCCDARIDIFESDLFLEYRKKIEKYLGYDESEKYDNVEAFFFYKAFVEMCSRRNSYEADSTKAVCVYFKEKNNCFQEADIVLREATNPNKYLLKVGKQKYCGDVMTSPWPLLKEYLRLNNAIKLENGNVPLHKRKAYKRAGYGKNKEMWLLYFLENYHSKSEQDRDKIIPEQVRKFLRNTYHYGAMWMIPVGCNATKMLAFKGQSGREEKYDFGDLALTSIWEWYSKHVTQPNEASQSLSKLFGGEIKSTECCEIWLRNFSDWDEFVRENELATMVKRGRGFCKRYEKPIMFFEGHSYQNMHPQTEEQWLEMFDTIGQLIYDRR